MAEMPVPKVLIVDDDAESRELLREVLQSNGFAAGTVADGKAAREALSNEAEYRIVIADLRMPNETGLELLRNLRGEKTKYDIILMSSFISNQERKLAQELGVRALIEKPFRLSDLLEIVGALAAKQAIGITP